MPTWLLKERQSGLRELMDDPGCDPHKLEATYRHFRLLNRLVSNWRRVYLGWLRPELQAGARTLLDIGCGGGDLIDLLSGWALKDGFALEPLGIDPDARAVRYASAHVRTPGARFVAAHSSDLASAGERFDLVISNHLLHHLKDEEVPAICRDSERLALRLALHSDLNRSDLAFLAFNLTWPFFLDSFITPDGLTSIRRTFTRAELLELAPAGWRVEALWPYRNLLLYRP